MREIKPLFIVKARHATISGGYYRTYEILKNGKSEGINYLVVTDALSYQNYVRLFHDFNDIMKKYKTFFIGNSKPNTSGSSLIRPIRSFHNSLAYATSIYKISREENPDIIIGPSEDLIQTTYLSGELCCKPWSVNFTGTKALLQPEKGITSIRLLNILKHINRKELTKNTSFKAKIGYALELMNLLKIAERSLILTVSPSVKAELTQLNPKIKIHVITPGNGVNLKLTHEKRTSVPIYDGIFFSRIVPEKGIFDLLKIWKAVVKKFSKAKLAVVGPAEDHMILSRFKKIIDCLNLTSNVTYLGPQNRDSLIDIVMSSKVMIYPTYLDTFSLAILESLACGIPVVTYDILATKYNFYKCKAVLRCPVGDIKSMANEIMLLLENEDLRMQISKEAKEFAKGFSWKNVVKAEKEAYFKVIEWFYSC